MGARRKSVVLLSGGLDSSANLALCQVHDEPVLALTVDYGQRAAHREIEAAGRLARHFGVEHCVLELRWLGALGGSALTEASGEMPHPDSKDLDDREKGLESAAKVWVPNRNGVLINVAAAFAERLEAEQVVVGFNREEAATFPDNSEEFLGRATRALELSSSNHARVACYTVRMDKREIVRELEERTPEFPWELVWSCYEGSEKPCGLCESCRRLERALASRRNVR
jgi:7-cyano-7-deazaguanine synthase